MEIIKKHMFIMALICITKLSFSQSELPNSIVSFGIGAGPNYGVFGTKTVIGYKNSGLLLGAGALAGLFAYEIGVQFSPTWFFLNLGYGVYGLSVNGNTGKQELIKGLIFIVGGMINLGKQKKIFIDLGIGYAGGGSIKTSFGQTLDVNGPSGIIGIGYRIGDIN